MLKKSRRASKRSKNNTAKMDYGTLESRRLLAGNVMVNNGEQLFMRGDGADNHVEVIGREDGSISIIGRNGTTINNRSEPLVISGNAAESDASIYNVVASIDSGLRAHMGPGDDVLQVQGIEFGDSSIVFGGTGDDSVGMYQNSFEGLVVQTWTGDDSISLEQATVNGDLFIFGLDGEDTIGVETSQLFANSVLVGNDGADRILVDLVDQIDPESFALVIGSEGDDFLETSDVLNYGFLGAFGGEGSDKVFVQNAREDSLIDPSDPDSGFLNGEVRAGGQAGNDTFADAGFLDFPVQVGTFENTGFEDNDDYFTDFDITRDLTWNKARLGTIGDWVFSRGDNPDVNFETLADAIEATELNTVTNNPGTLTLFAPTDAAFEKLPEGLLGSLSTDQLRDILKFHVSGETIFSPELVTLDSVDTLLDDSPFTVSVDDDGVTLNGDVTLSTTDIRTKNGVLHVLNEVLIPQNDS